MCIRDRPQPDTDNGKEKGDSIKPYIKDDSGKEGWDVIKPQLEEAKAGDTVTVAKMCIRDRLFPG